MPRKRKPRRAITKDLLFITDHSLRVKIEDAIETISLLYLLNQNKGLSEGFAKENRRMMILYAASVIEAVLLYLYKKKECSINKTEYTKVHTLPQTYQLETGLTLVLAKQVQTPKNDRELMLDVLLKYFSESGLITESLKKKIEKAKNVRNTFHLSKSRKGIPCGNLTVKSSSEAVLGTLNAVRKSLAANS